jgi:hypothetical protein
MPVPSGETGPHLKAIDCLAISQELISRFIEIEAVAVKLGAFLKGFFHN